MITITLNGTHQVLEKSISIADFVASKKLHAESIVIEHNYRIVKHEEWHEAMLVDDDRLEVLSFVGGG